MKLGAQENHYQVVISCSLRASADTGFLTLHPLLTAHTCTFKLYNLALNFGTLINYVKSMKLIFA